MSYNILIIEDEKNIANVIKAYLEREGYNVFTALTGETGLEIFESKDIHLLILDLMLPGISGENLCKKIRSTSNIPIIMLTAKIDLDSRIEGLSLGADDYISKPFNNKELILRVNNLIKRAYNINVDSKKIYIDNNIVLYMDSLEARQNLKLLNLTSNEFKLLASLAQNPNRILSRTQLINKTFGSNYDGYDRTIDTYVKNIRKEIEVDPKNPKIIETVYGLGYKLIKK